MDKFANTAWAAVLPLLLVYNGCDVYDPSHRRADDERAAEGSTEADAAGSNESDDAGFAPEADDQCGNALIDPGERCDVAIARGRPGACPEGCSGRDGCIERALVGRACTARCADFEITEAVPEDGCCPPEETAATDSDCDGECGNGLVERGERCDPPSACARDEACKSEDACRSAHYSGDPDRCTASCELRPVHACVSGDGCCPPGCAHEADQDCQAPDAGAPCGENCDAATEPDTQSKPDPQSDCQMRHPGGPCESCDCDKCRDVTTACLTAPRQEEAAKCEAVIRCAAEAGCTNLECLCGGANAQRCRNTALGPCASEIRAAGGARDPDALIAVASVDGSTLGRAVAVMSCRQRECREACGL